MHFSVVKVSFILMCGACVHVHVYLGNSLSLSYVTNILIQSLMHRHHAKVIINELRHMRSLIRAFASRFYIL